MNLVVYGLAYKFARVFECLKLFSVLALRAVKCAQHTQALSIQHLSSVTQLEVF